MITWLTRNVKLMTMGGTRPSWVKKFAEMRLSVAKAKTQKCEGGKLKLI